MKWYPAKRFGLQQDLRPCLNVLQAHGLQVHVTEEVGAQVLWLSSPLSEAELDELLRTGNTITVPTATVSATAQKASGVASTFSFQRLWRGQPLTLALILFSVFGALITAWDVGLNMVRILSFTDFNASQGRLFFADLSNTLRAGEWWRLLTPMFLHFGPLHVLFNSLWLWELGRRIERMQSWRRLLLVVLVTSLGANLLQYAMSGPSLFGGMSGVVYGLVGYIALWQRLEGNGSFNVSPALLGFMLLFLVVGFTGAVDFFIDGSVANGAHLGGLLSGVGLAAGILFVKRLLPMRKGSN